MQRYLLRTAFLLLLSSIIFAAAGVRKDEKTPPVAHATPRVELPADLLHAMQSRFPDYRIPDKSDYSGKSDEDPNRMYYLSTLSGDSAMPYFCEGDFNGDGKPEIALILVPRREPSEHEGAKGRKPQLVLFQKGDNGYSVQTLWEAKTAGIAWWNYRVRTLPPQQITYYPSGDRPDHSVTPRYECLRFEYWEGGAAIFYYEDGTFKQVWTEE
jgi:hypothetical protein